MHHTLNGPWLSFQLLFMIPSPYVLSPCSYLHGFAVSLAKHGLLHFFNFQISAQILPLLASLAKIKFSFFHAPMTFYLSPLLKLAHCMEMVCVSIPPLWASWKQGLCSVRLRSFCSLPHVGELVAITNFYCAFALSFSDVLTHLVFPVTWKGTFHNNPHVLCEEPEALWLCTLLKVRKQENDI